MSTVYCMVIAAMLLILGGAAGAVILGLCMVGALAGASVLWLAYKVTEKMR